MVKDPMTRRGGDRSDEEGFALALVVMLLFAVGILGATGYQMALVNSALAVQGSEGQRALSIARAGLHQYLATEIGVPDDTVTYSIEGGDAVVTSRLISQTSDTTSLWMIKSEGVYLDPASNASAARRTIYQYADHRDVPFDFEATLVMASGNLTVTSGPNNRVDGDDSAGGGECTQSSDDIVGAMFGSGGATWAGGDLRGDPDTALVGSYQAVLDSIGLSWDVLTDTNFTPDFENRWPTGLPADSFPVVRFNYGTSGYGGVTRRGVLIVNGVFYPRFGFEWNGIIMARAIQPLNTGWNFFDEFHIRGIVITGLGDTGANLTIGQYHEIEYHRCHAYNAGRSLGYFRPIEDAWWEGG